MIVSYLCLLPGIGKRVNFILPKKASVHTVAHHFFIAFALTWSQAPWTTEHSWPIHLSKFPSHLASTDEWTMVHWSSWCTLSKGPEIVQKVSNNEYPTLGLPSTPQRLIFSFYSSQLKCHFFRESFLVLNGTSIPNGVTNVMVLSFWC